MTPAVNKKFRILRAIEGEGDAQKTEDFVVKAAFLSFSEVLEPMGDTDAEVLVSDDNVIPMRDSIESVRALVGWLTREPGFEINQKNMRELAHLSDKYIIESLRKDIRIYLKTGAFAGEPQTLELWEFSARFEFDEMERYCRQDVTVVRQIDSIISDPSKGVEYLLSRHLPVPFVSKLVCDFATRRAQDVGWLMHCLTAPTDSYRSTPAIPATPATTAWGLAAERTVHNRQNNIGQVTGHMKEYHDEVRKGRLDYASDGKVGCLVCHLNNHAPEGIHLERILSPSYM